MQQIPIPNERNNVMNNHSAKLVDIIDLKVSFNSLRGVVWAVNGVDMQIYKERTLGVVGESGCGKSVTASAILSLLPKPQAQVSGKILFTDRKGITKDIVTLPPRSNAINTIRGSEISMIFQEPMTSLNPVFSIGAQISEAVLLHQQVSKSEARMRTIEMLSKVGIPSPIKRLNEYPHQFSGGMRQRVMIAMAMSCNPSLLIADEPTTALDVTIQAQILELMDTIKDEYKTSIMLITHDLGVIAAMAQDVAVMYLGKIVEYGNVKQIFKNHLHPYTEGLMRSIPILGQRSSGRRLVPIKGMVPDARILPVGCGFASRCPYRLPICAKAPPMLEIESGYHVRCWLHSKSHQKVEEKVEVIAV